jgi:hypothetical protein
MKDKYVKHWKDSEISEDGETMNQKRFLKKETRKRRRREMKKLINRENI